MKYLIALPLAVLALPASSSSLFANHPLLETSCTNILISLNRTEFNAQVETAARLLKDPAFQVSAREAESNERYQKEMRDACRQQPESSLGELAQGMMQPSVSKTIGDWEATSHQGKPIQMQSCQSGQCAAIEVSSQQQAEAPAVALSVTQSCKSLEVKPGSEFDVKANGQAITMTAQCGNNRISLVPKTETQDQENAKGLFDAFWTSSAVVLEVGDESYSFSSSGFNKAYKTLVAMLD